MIAGSTLDWSVFEPIATTVLYEGHVLYPYRPSALKNRQQWNFGTLFPPAWRAEPSEIVLQALIETGDGDASAPEVELRLCFLLRGAEHVLGAGTTVLGTVCCQLAWQVEAVEPGLWKLTARAANLTVAPAEADREAMLEWALQSAHLRCAVPGAAFISAQDPGPRQQAADACHCQGVYPVLIGPPGEHRYLLAAPIILEDHPRIAPQSQGDFCDATEMDELLTLRVATLTDSEKDEVRATGGTALAILERCERTGALAGLHAGLDSEFDATNWEAFAAPPESVRVGAAEVRVGDRVRIHGGERPGRDLFDQVLDGRIAIVQAIEQDLEGAIHLAVVAEDDPGRDLGELRQTGHRFFFSAAEIEPL